MYFWFLESESNTVTLDLCVFIWSFQRTIYWLLARGDEEEMVVLTDNVQ